MMTDTDHNFTRISSELGQIEDYVRKIEPKAKMLDLLKEADNILFAKLSMKVLEHPEGYEETCLCQLCLGCAD